MEKLGLLGSYFLSNLFTYFNLFLRRMVTTASEKQEKLNSRRMLGNPDQEEQLLLALADSSKLLFISVHIDELGWDPARTFRIRPKVALQHMDKNNKNSNGESFMHLFLQF
jgi:hypothetical protein